MPVRLSGEEGKLERMLETLARTNLLKDSARADGSVYDGKDGVFLL